MPVVSGGLFDSDDIITRDGRRLSTLHTILPVRQNIGCETERMFSEERIYCWMANWGRGASTVRTPSVERVEEICSGFVPRGRRNSCNTF